MKLLDLDENWLTNLGKAGIRGIKKGASYLTSPQGLYKTDADAIAAKTAQQSVEKATAAVAKNKNAIANAQSQQQVAKLQKTGATASDKLAAAKADLKTAPQKPFTAGQQVARTGTVAGTGAAAGVAADRTLSSDEPTAVEPKKVDVTPTAVELTTDKPAVDTTPASVPATKDDDDDIPLPPTNESIIDILKLSGQKSITARDNVAGIIKPKEIIALNESKQLDECGGIMPQSSHTNQPATLNISASASNGDEVANMLMSIMQLAGVKPVSQDMMPHDHSGVEIKPMQVLGGISNEEMAEETYDNTPEDPTDVPVFDPEKMVFRPNQAGQGDRMDGTMPKGNPTMKEEHSVHSNLLKAYEAFKNSQ
jgi:hypothetical protein